MKTKALLIALVLAAMPALAQTPSPRDTCPADMAAIDKALPNVKQKTGAQLNEINRLRTEGERMHNAGKHVEGMAALAKTKELIGIK